MTKSHGVTLVGRAYSCLHAKFCNALSTSATDLYLHFMMFACIPQVNDSECNLLELSPIAGYTVRGYAVFDGPTLTGRITFVR